MISSEILKKDLSFSQKLRVKMHLYSNVEYPRKSFPHTVIYDWFCFREHFVEASFEIFVVICFGIRLIPPSRFPDPLIEVLRS